ncbi:MAG: hypothetical protein KatS3mg087_0045 [Patescibacteria group bacterium]|nr:MAG: hypothetical protein KatS3mg087_0045 [Patescibacteria group bacterium]
MCAWRSVGGVKKVYKEKMHLRWGRTITIANPETAGPFSDYDWGKNYLILGRGKKVVRLTLYRVPSPVGYYEVNTEEQLAKLALIPLELILEDLSELQDVDKPFHAYQIYPELIRFTRYRNDIIRRDKAFLNNLFKKKRFNTFDLFDLWAVLKFLTGEPIDWAGIVYQVADIIAIPMCVIYAEEYKTYLYRAILEKRNQERAMVYTWWKKPPDINAFQMTDQELTHILDHITGKANWVSDKKTRALIEELQQLDIKSGKICSKNVPAV